MLLAPMRFVAHRYWFSLFALLGSAACSSDKQEPTQVNKEVIHATALNKITPYFNSEWAMNKLWEDSLAEVATYTVEQTAVSKPQRFDCTLITVKEEFSLQYNVKSDDYKRKDLFPVIKVNQIYSVPGELAPRSCLTSMFFRRDQPVPLYKLAASSQDWNGTTFKAVFDDGLQYVETYNSYKDRQGTGERQLRRDVLFEEALPYTLRCLQFERKPAFGVSVCAVQQPNNYQAPVYYAAQLRVADGLEADTPEPAWRVTVALADEKKNVYWFAKKYPNLMLRQNTWNGRNMTLKEVRRVAL